MKDFPPGQQPPDARETAEGEANAELEPEPKAKPAAPHPGDPAEKEGPESQFHG